MTHDPPRVVFDCVIFAQALINPKGPAGECVSAAERGECLQHLSAFLIQEIRELPTKLTPRLGVTPERVESLIKHICDYAIVVTDIPAVYVLAADPQDSEYVNLALVTKSELIVSRDRHLLTLMSPDTQQGRLFMQQFPDLRVLKPVEFLRELEMQRSIIATANESHSDAGSADGPMPE